MADNRRSTQSLRPFFAPESVAVIGASRTPGKGGYNIIENLLRLGYAGRIYPVNPRAGEVCNLKAYPDLKHIPGMPELAIIILPPSQVVKSLEECIAAGVKAVIIESAGFGEMDASGARREQRMVRLAAEAGIRFMGPNSVGTINPAARFDTSLGRLNEIFLPQGEIREGSVGFIGQTGLFTGVFLPLINDEIGLSQVACLGNKCDVDEGHRHVPGKHQRRAALPRSEPPDYSKEADNRPEVGGHGGRGQGIGHAHRFYRRGRQDL
jgi:acetyltransferase